MKKHASEHPSHAEKHPIEVPRDAKLDAGTTPPTPPHDAEQWRDEDYTDREKPLIGDSDLAKIRHENPPKGKDQLGVGTAGDAARPSKTGIYGKPIPPRGRVR
jgi:hypothetical protein